MLRPAAAAALAVIAAVGAAAGTAAAEEVADDGTRWGPVAEQLGIGSAICPATMPGDENIVCAVLLCEEGSLTLGVLGAGIGTDGGEKPAFRGEIAVDGEGLERDMQSRVVMGDFLHVRTRVDPGEPLWRRLRAGNRVSLPSSPEGDPLDYSLRGSAVELDRVAAGCR
jgi:hypothetical protein